jgi:ABC-type nickel/cobalt efflux system permease component RcnA
MPEAHEQLEQAEHAEHAAHSNKGIALLISVLALFLAFSETLGKSAQTEALSFNVEAADTWAFYQAKTIRSSALGVAIDTMTLTSAATTDPALKDAQAKQIEAWKKTAARYDDEPGKEGRKQLMEKAREAEHERDTALAKYHHFEIASAAFQIGIVLASATIITGMIALAWVAGGLGVIGAIFMAIGLFAPHAVHFM